MVSDCTRRPVYAVGTEVTEEALERGPDLGVRTAAKIVGCKSRHVGPRHNRRHIAIRIVPQLPCNVPTQGILNISRFIARLERHQAPSPNEWPLRLL